MCLNALLMSYHLLRLSACFIIQLNFLELIWYAKHCKSSTNRFSIEISHPKGPFLNLVPEFKVRKTSYLAGILFDFIKNIHILAPKLLTSRVCWNILARGQSKFYIEIDVLFGKYETEIKYGQLSIFRVSGSIYSHQNSTIIGDWLNLSFLRRTKTQKLNITLSLIASKRTQIFGRNLNSNSSEMMIQFQIINRDNSSKIIFTINKMNDLWWQNHFFIICWC